MNQGRVEQGKKLGELLARLIFERTDFIYEGRFVINDPQQNSQQVRYYEGTMRITPEGIDGKCTIIGTSSQFYEEINLQIGTIGWVIKRGIWTSRGPLELGIIAQLGKSKYWDFNSKAIFLA